MNLELTEAQIEAIEELKDWWVTVTPPMPYMGVPGPVVVEVKSDWNSMYIVIEEDGYRHS